MWTKKQNIKKISDRSEKRHADQLVLEKKSTIKLNGHKIFSGIHTATLEKEWGLGYLLAHDKIDFNIESIHYENDTISIQANEACLMPVIHANYLKPNKDHIFKLTGYFQEAAILYKKTAVSESAAIAIKDKLLINAEDISQKNAFYKVLGHYGLNYKKNTNSCTLMLSSTIDTDLMQAIVRSGFDMVITRTAPTQQALELAQSFHVSILGFARGRKFNWYTKN